MDFDLEFVPGGHNPMADLVTSQQFGSLMGAVDLANKPVVAVCHGPDTLLPEVGSDGKWLLAGRRLI